MRLHRLRLQAFQAFGGAEEVDFDALSDAGLFLLRGETGAGKTTVLDAVCFALYGVVPGARAEVGRLRSDHAAADVRTEVELEATLRGTRVRVWRAPKQERPKVRGSGLTEEQHAVRVSVHEADGSWRVLSTRVDEARLEVERLVGMTAAQFCQVVLLPQGRFAEFLRARSEDRRVLLEQLFETQRFADAEEWLKRRADAAWRDADDAGAAVGEVVARIAQVVGADAAPEDVVAWAAALAVGAAADEALAAGARDEAAARSASLAATLTDARELAALRARWTSARDTSRALAERRGARDAAAAELAAARRAAPVVPLLDAVDARTAALAGARSAEDGAIAAAPALAAPPPSDRAQGTPPAPGGDLRPADRDHGAATDDEQLSLFGAPPADVVEAPEALLEVPRDPFRAAAADLRARAGEVRALAPVEARLEAARDAVERLEAAAARHEVAGAEASQALASARDERGTAQVVLDAAAAAAARLDGLRARRQRVDERATAAARRDALTGAVEAARRTRDAARGTAMDAKARWLDLREQRLAGMATELAEQLRDGEPCPVCGSTEHPAPAGGPHDPDAVRAFVGALAGRPPEVPDVADGPPDGTTGDVDPSAGPDVPATTPGGGPRDVRALEAAAQEEHERCDTAARAAGERAAELERELAAAVAIAGDAAAEELAAERKRLDGQITDAERQAAAGADAASALDALARHIEEQEDRRATAEREAATARTSAKERRAALAADAQRLAAALGDAPDVATRAQQLEQDADRCDAAAGARDARVRAERELDAALAAAVVAARDAGFAPRGAGPTAGAAGLAPTLRERLSDPEAQTLAAARAAVRGAERQQDLETKLTRFDEQVAAVTAQLEDPELAAASRRRPPDLAALEEAQAQADRDERTAVESHALAQQRVRQLAELRRRLDAAVQQAEPARRTAQQLRDLAKLVDGTSSQNARRMRLSAYVLAARLEEIAAAASERLTRMSAGRYALVHCDEGHTQRGRAGLELRVVDGWTGEERHPGTLSGGETFLASLALALGLADVVTHEAGGARLETLFVDEGFGSLDERALDEVLDVLDRLRDGGRAVGIVSHVQELRHRIPAQLHVRKGRDGSTVEAPTLSATP